MPGLNTSCKPTLAFGFKVTGTTIISTLGGVNDYCGNEKCLQVVEERGCSHSNPASTILRVRLGWLPAKNWYLFRSSDTNLGHDTLIVC